MDEVAHPLFLRPEVVCEAVMRLDLKHHPFDGLHPRPLNRLNLRRVVRHHPHTAQAEIEEYLRALVVPAQVNLQTQSLVGLDGVGPLVLQSVCANLVDDADATPLLELVDDGPASLGAR